MRATKSNLGRLDFIFRKAGRLQHSVTWHSTLLCIPVRSPATCLGVPRTGVHWIAQQYLCNPTRQRLGRLYMRLLTVMRILCITGLRCRAYLTWLPSDSAPRPTALLPLPRDVRNCSPTRHRGPSRGANHANDCCQMCQ
jgi:hypothetical protein